jgi:hypothetical protein
MSCATALGLVVAVLVQSQPRVEVFAGRMRSARANAARTATAA